MAYRIVITTYMQCFTKSGIILAEQWAWGGGGGGGGLGEVFRKSA